jgi:hypothetical protein
MKSIAVVGNGPKASFSPDSAAKIDACEKVFRLNNYQSGKLYPFAGKRVTHWATAFAHNIEDRPVENVWVTLPLLSVGWHKAHGRFYDYNAPLFFFALQTREVRMIPAEVYRFAGRLSAGMLLLYWLYVERGWTLEGIVIEGFSFFDPSQPHHYADDGETGGEHSPDIEREFFAKMQREEIR